MKQQWLTPNLQSGYVNQCLKKQLLQQIVMDLKLYKKFIEKERAMANGGGLVAFVKGNHK